MSVRAWGTGGLVGLVLCWAGVGYEITRSPDVHDYRVAAVESAQSAYHAVETAWLVGQARLDGRVLGPYVDSVWEDGRDALAGAAKRFAGGTSVDDATARMRGRLGPLLLAAGARLDAVRNAADDADPAALRRAVGELPSVAGQLDAFIEEYG